MGDLGAAAPVPVPGSCVLVRAQSGVPGVVGVVGVLLPQTASEVSWGVESNPVHGCLDEALGGWGCSCCCCCCRCCCSGLVPGLLLLPLNCLGRCPGQCNGCSCCCRCCRVVWVQLRRCRQDCCCRGMLGRSDCCCLLLLSERHGCCWVCRGASRVRNKGEALGSRCSPIGTPLSARTTDGPPIKSPPLNTKKFDYPALVGKLLYLSNCTRPDITAAVNYLSRFMSSPTDVHWEQAKRVLRYVKGTMHYTLQ